MGFLVTGFRQIRNVRQYEFRSKGIASENFTVSADLSQADFAALERAYNLLADPHLRAAYSELLIKPDAPAPFPYSGFGSVLVEGAPEGDTFFARRIFAFLPERRRRALRDVTRLPAAVRDFCGPQFPLPLK